ncbi:MAG: hypothetical protein Q7S27_04910 [Nanoarchaeota archaeon]|nr:hypothetical protein [Nanoarchaeota archaeon]
MRKEILLGIVILFVLVVGVEAQVGGSFSQSVTYQHRASYQAIYGPEDRLNTYWPILGDKETCQARQDFILQISPAGCQPAVVRSDLLAEQNVPVFCQIDALQINPLIDVDKIRSLRFTGKYPQEILGAGFHPARAALRTRDKLLGSPLINNIGYVVVVLKKNPVEKNVPDFVNVTLSAQIDYEAGNAFGIGKAEFILEPVSDYEWETQKFKQSFWNGRYFVRLEQVDPNFVVVSLFSGERKISTTRVGRGETSSSIWVPGVYCRAGVKVTYDGLVAAENKATISISDDKGTDILDVYDGSRFLNDKCSVDKIEIYDEKSSSTVKAGNVSIRCSDGQRLELKLGDVLKEDKWHLSEKYDPTKRIDVFLDLGKKIKSGIYFKDAKVYLEYIENDVNFDGPLFVLEIGEVRNNVVYMDAIKFGDAIKDVNLNVINEVKNSFELLDGAKIVNEELKLDAYNINSNIDELNLGDENENKLREAISAFRNVSDQYPAERDSNSKDGESWGERALKKAIDLASLAGKEKIRADLIKEFVDRYPDSNFADSYRYEYNQIVSTDFSRAGGVINIDQRFYNVRLVDLEIPRKQSSADFALTGVESGNVKVNLNELKNIIDRGVGSIDSIRLDKIHDEENVKASINCRVEKSGGGYGLKSESYNLKLNDEATKVCDKAFIKLRDTHIEQIAKVRLIPEAQGTRTETNLTVNIGIEKRAIKLSPDKTSEMIENLNESIKKWENINEKLGKVVSGLKGACFATAGVLTVKNFISGIGGEALARQKVMVGWTKECSDLVNANPPKYPTLNACYLAKSDEINKDVSSANEAINQINTRIEGIERNYVESSSIGGTDINRGKAAVAYCNDLKTRYGTRDVKIKEGANERTLKFSEVLGDCEQGYNNQGLYGYNELREIEYNLIMKDRASSVNVKDSSNRLLQGSYDQIYENRHRYEEVEKAKATKTLGLPSVPIAPTSSIRKNVVGEVVSVGGVSSDVKIDKLDKEKNTHLASMSTYNTEGFTVNGIKRKGFKGGDIYLLGLNKDTEGYSVQEVYRKTGDNKYEILDSSERGDFLDIYGIGRITPADSVSYANSYENPEVRYYETEPYKGMPAIVPFDVRDGWYAATRQTLPAFGGIGAFDSSGRVTSFYLCNVGPNHKEQFFEGYGDDICQLINLNTGQPYGFFPGLSETEAKRRVGQAVGAIEDAANQYGRKLARVAGKDFAVGRPAANIPSTQCQNFMSPEECHLMFNVCDPVICPSSRCDFGGQYPVADVVQTGIIGSTLLCLPNIREKIIIPVCLTGIHAGIDGFVSILKNHRDCLQESLETGRTIGICDQIYSIYLCEFFWRQISPVAKVILPKIVELAYGQGTRGGGEYLTVSAAWQNTQDSVNYFTQSYAANSIKAFQARSIEEAGAPFCKAFVSAKAPTSFESLIEPDSPPQFHAWFSATRFTDATVPATSQYKVFYHIFSGKDQGVHYSVYMKNPPTSSYYSLPAIVHVASGFVGRGQYATESKDFTAPEGYKELCVRVNDKEECGFKEVSTSFAINSLRDSYVADQAKESEIKTEGECISGSTSLKATVLSPNIGANAEEAGLPQIYNRGIVRICSSKNPGSATDPSRFADKGFCGDPKLRCWLDKNSVANAITDNNAGVRDATLSEIEKTQREDLANKGIIVGDDVAVEEIKQIRDSINMLRTKAEVSDQEVTETTIRLDSLFDRVVLNHHKAQILYLIGDSKAVQVEKIIAKIRNQESRKSEVVKGTEVPTPTETPKATATVTPKSTLSPEATPQVTNNPVKLTLGQDYNSKIKIYLYKDGKITDIYFLNSEIFIEDFALWIDRRIGKVNKNKIEVFSYNIDDTNTALGGEYDEFFDGYFVEGRNIIKIEGTKEVIDAERSEGDYQYILSNEYNPENTISIIEKSSTADRIILIIEKGKIYTPQLKILIGNVRPIEEGLFEIQLISEANSVNGLQAYLDSKGLFIPESKVLIYYNLNNAIIEGKEIIISLT